MNTNHYYIAIGIILIITSIVVTQKIKEIEQEQYEHRPYSTDIIVIDTPVGIRYVDTNQLASILVRCVKKLRKCQVVIFTSQWQRLVLEAIKELDAFIKQGGDACNIDIEKRIIKNMKNIDNNVEVADIETKGIIRNSSLRSDVDEYPNLHITQDEVLNKLLDRLETAIYALKKKLCNKGKLNISRLFKILYNTTNTTGTTSTHTTSTNINHTDIIAELPMEPMSNMENYNREQSFEERVATDLMYHTDKLSKTIPSDYYTVEVAGCLSHDPHLDSPNFVKNCMWYDVAGRKLLVDGTGSPPSMLGDLRHSLHT